MKPPKLKHVPKDQKELQMQLGELFVLSNLLVSKLDFPNVQKSEQTKNIIKKAETFSAALRPIIDQFYESNHVSSSTFFIDLERKFEYNFEKAYKKYK